MDGRTRRRYFVNSLMLGLTGVCTLLTVSILFLILGYLVWNGGKALDWAFFTQLPKPPGEEGGGMANAIVGSAKLVLLGAAIGIPVGFLAGVYLSGVRRQDLPLYHSLYLRSVEWCAFDRDRHFRLDGDCSSDEAFFRMGRRIRIEPDVDSHCYAQHGAVPACSSHLNARRLAGAQSREVANGGEQWWCRHPSPEFSRA